MLLHSSPKARYVKSKRDLSHIELTRSDNISSSSKARTYRVDEVDISTERKIRARIEGFLPLLLLFSAGLGVPRIEVGAFGVHVFGFGLSQYLRLTGQMRCSHLTAFFKFSAKNITLYGWFFFYTMPLLDLYILTPLSRYLRAAFVSEVCSVHLSQLTRCATVHLYTGVVEGAYTLEATLKRDLGYR